MFSRPPRFLLLLLFAILLWVPEYLGRNLWDPDEARYGYIAREMRDGGTWAIPHRHGVYYAHKPPLIFWMSNAFGLVTGDIDRVSARLPSLVGALLGLLAATRLAALWFGPAASWGTLLILSTSFLFWNKGGTGQIDALLCGLQMTALYGLFTRDLVAGRRFLRTAMAWSCMGLAILAKGPVGLLVPVGAYVAATLASGERRRLASLHWLWGLALALAFPAAWLLWIHLEGAPPGYLDELLYKQNIDRAAGGMGHHAPFYYYLLRFPTHFFPWTLFLPAVFLAWRRHADFARAARTPLAWGLFVIAFFSISPGKRDLYILLSYPAAAILLAGAWTRFSPRQRRIPLRIFGGCCMMVALVIAGGVIHHARTGAFEFNAWTLLPLAPVFAVGAWLCWREPESGPAWRPLAVVGGTMLAAQVCVANVVYPAFDPLKTPGAVTEAAKSLLGPDDPVLMYRINGEILAYHARRPGQAHWTPEALGQAIRRHPKALVVLETKRFTELPDSIRGKGEWSDFVMGGKELCWMYSAPSP